MPRPTLWSLAACASAVVVFAPVVAVASTVSHGRAEADVVFRIGPEEIDESSSLVVSTVDPHLVYTTNDSGDAANVYVLDSRTGDLVGTTSLTGVDPIDIEALAGGTDGSLVVADIGDNDGVHDSVTVYRIPQPGRGDHSVTPDALSLTYQGGPRDAESVLYDAASGRVLVVDKDFAMPRVYGTPPKAFSRASAVLTPVASAPTIATDATFLPSGDVVVIRTYLEAVFYSYPAWDRLASLTLPLERQGESIAAPDDKHIWIGSEGVHSEVLSVDVPDLTVEPPTTSTPPTGEQPPSTDTTTRDEHELAARNVVLVAGSLLLLVIAIGVFRYRRHHSSHGQ